MLAAGFSLSSWFEYVQAFENYDFYPFRLHIYTRFFIVLHIFPDLSFKLEIVDKGFQNGFNFAFQFVVKIFSYYLHVSFLERGKSYELCPAGLSISKLLKNMMF